MPLFFCAICANICLIANTETAVSRASVAPRQKADRALEPKALLLYCFVCNSLLTPHDVLVSQGQLDTDSVIL